MTKKDEKGSGTRARPRLTVLAGPSGVGKSSVLEELRTLGTEVYYSVSVTTRRPRPGEVDGEHYHFVDRPEYDRMVADGELLEHAEYAGNCYGTPRRPVEAALERGTPAILEIEVQGARQVRRAMPEALLVLLKPPTWEVLVSRLTGRGTEDPAVVAHRLKVAEEELAAEEEFDVVLVNSDVRTVARHLLTLVVGSPTQRVSSEP